MVNVPLEIKKTIDIDVMTCRSSLTPVGQHPSLIPRISIKIVVEYAILVNTRR